MSVAVPFREGTTQPTDREERDTCTALLLRALSNADDPLDAATVSLLLREACHRGERLLPWRVSHFWTMEEHELKDLLTFLFHAGAVDDEPGLTALGRWALTRLHPAQVTPQMSAGDLLSEVERRPPRDLYQAVWPWVQAHGIEAALRDLLAEAGHASTLRRRIALDIATQLPVTSNKLWRQIADHPILGPSARRVLRHYDSTERPASSQDQLWMAVDECAAAWLAGDTMRTLEHFHDLPGTNGAERMHALRASGHPDAEALADHLANTGAEHSQPTVYQLKISLVGWNVWRRVLVRSTLTLGDLHEVIRDVLDWDDDHLHLFEDSGRRYGSAWHDLDADDEDAVLVADVFQRTGSTLRYTYDLGDCWEHEITCQKILKGGPGTAYPVCAAGRGDSPIEDASPGRGGIYPTRHFDIDNVNQRLALTFSEGGHPER
jgi:hypothetical protein